MQNPFAALGKLTGITPEPEKAAPAEPKAPVVPGAPARAVLRLERSGRGGKEVTVVEHLGLPPAERERWLKALKSGLGCGGSLEGDAIVLQGDQRDRAASLLTARGVRKITRG